MMRSLQTYPTKQMRLVEPFGAGGGPDVVARAMGQKLSELWGCPVTVENHPGQGSTAAAALVAKAPADGHTVLISTSAHAYGAALMDKLPYHPLKDFIPVVPLTSQAYILAAGEHTAITSVAKLISIAMARPGQLKFGSPGIATGTHVGLEKFNLQAGIRAQHIPAQPDQSIVDVIAGTIAGDTDYIMGPASFVLPQTRAGKLRALGVSSLRRSPALPDVPSIAEAALPGFDFPIWYGAWLPAGTPGAIVDKLARDIARVLAMPDLQDRLAEHGAEVMRLTPLAFAKFVLSESEAAVRIIKQAANASC